MTLISDTAVLGTTIRTERKRQQLTQAELAALAGVGGRFLRELEKGKSSCQIGRAIDVLNALGIQLDATTRVER